MREVLARKANKVRPIASDLSFAKESLRAGKPRIGALTSIFYQGSFYHLVPNALSSLMIYVDSTSSAKIVQHAIIILIDFHIDNH